MSSDLRSKMLKSSRQIKDVAECLVDYFNSEHFEELGTDNLEEWAGDLIGEVETFLLQFEEYMRPIA